MSLVGTGPYAPGESGLRVVMEVISPPDVSDIPAMLSPPDVSDISVMLSPPDVSDIPAMLSPPGVFDIPVMLSPPTSSVRPIIAEYDPKKRGVRTELADLVLTK
uniref:Uncharacterized protein n=1 Tax=Timema genevievae TaxID=629358 RepID=A0A7R9PLM3_TIMGE|nr:unnamed protein product [Timema genevievae]